MATEEDLETGQFCLSTYGGTVGSAGSVEDY
jgi:hypothetical protein